MCMIAVYGLGMAGRTVVEGGSRGRGIRFEAYVPESSQMSVPQRISFC